MEGNQLTFFVTFEDRQAIITLSEYDSVEQLKIEIDHNFNIPIMDQVISGWYSLPESDDIILQFCSKPFDVNCLAVQNRRSPRYDSSFTNENSTGNDMNAHAEENCLDMEMRAILLLKQNLPDNVPLNLQHLSLQEAVSLVTSNFEKKTLLLYLHNSQEVFSQQFLTYIYDDEMADILEKCFFIVGWDVADQSYHKALLSALEPHSSLSIISHLITGKVGALVCLLPEKGGLSIFSCLRGNQTYQNILGTLRNLERQLNLLETVNENASYPMEEQDDLHKSIEIEAIISLRNKLPSNNSVTFRHCSLDDAINFICTTPLEERKALFLYLHNSELPFSKMFSENLQSGEIVNILNRSFLVLGWDVEDTKYHDALVSALSRHINLSIVADLVTSKVSVGLCILPTSGTIRLSTCFRGKISTRDTLQKLKETEKAFKEEIKEEIKLKKIESEKSSANDLGSEKLHGIWADMLGDRDYDSFEFDQHEYLKDKIGFALKGPPEEESGYDAKTKDRITQLYEVIQTESNNIAEFRGKIEISFIYSCLEPLPEEKIKRAVKYNDYNPHTDVSPVPVFVLRKCRGSDNPCRIFIDDTGRVYESWKDFLLKNKYYECEMIVPLNGRYQVENDKVLLEKHLSPACHLDTKLLQVGDIVSTAAGLASGAIFVAAAIPAIPVAAPLLIGAGAVGLGAGVWAIGRSIHTLVDRAIHKETMSFANSEARGAYLNIVAGSLGFVGAGANMALTQLVKSGANIGQGATYLVNTVQVLNLSAGGASLVNSGYEVFDQWYNENQTPSALTILQLSTSVLFFGHAVYNFRGAQTIIDETQARVLQDYQDSLRSNRHRKTFNKLMKETIRTHGDGARGRAEVISAIRNIQNKDEVFAALTRNNKALNRAGIKFSADGGQIRLGGIPVDMNEFIGLNKRQTETFLTNLSQSNASQFTSNTTTTSNFNISLRTAVNDILSDIHVDSSGVNINQLMTLTSELLLFCSGDIKTKVVNAVHQAIVYVLGNLARPITEEIDKIIPKNLQFVEFLRLGISYFSKKVDDLEHDYQMYERTKDKEYYNPLFDHINPLYVKRTVAFFEIVVCNSYSGEALTRAVLIEISKYVTAWITRVIFENEEKKECERRRLVHSAGFKVKKINCSICGGYYFNK